MQAWLQGRLDIAEHLFSKIPVSDNGRGQDCVMDICYKIGSCALSHKQYDDSVKWLERALRACELVRHMDQSPVVSIKDKELLILHDSGRLLLIDDHGKYLMQDSSCRSSS